MASHCHFFALLWSRQPYPELSWVSCYSARGGSVPACATDDLYLAEHWWYNIESYHEKLWVTVTGLKAFTYNLYVYLYIICLDLCTDVFTAMWFLHFVGVLDNFVSISTCIAASLRSRYSLQCVVYKLRQLCELRPPSFPFLGEPSFTILRQARIGVCFCVERHALICILQFNLTV